jgi:hypothetical protein
MHSILLTMLIKSILFNPKYRIPQKYMDFMLCPTLQIDSNNQLRTTLYSNRDDFIFPIVNSLFKSSNIPVTHTYGVYIICYSAIRQGIYCDIPGLGSIFPEAQPKGIYIISRECHIVYPV